MPLVKKVTNVGNSAGMILDQPILRHLGWEIGTEIEIEVDKDRLVLTRHRQMSDETFQRVKRNVFRKHRRTIELLSK